MKLQRDAVQARNFLNFNVIKKAPQLQEDRFQPLLTGLEDTPIYVALTRAKDLKENATYYAGESGFARNLLGAASVAGTGAGIWAAVAGHPLIAGGVALATVASAGFGVGNHFLARKHQDEANLAGDAYKAISQAGDEVAAALISDGPGPDRYTDRRYYTGGIIAGIATVHSRESGALLRTQVDLGGAVPRRLEVNLAKNTVAVRSPKGDQTFAGGIELRDKGFRIYAHGTESSNDGPLSQQIEPSGASQIYLRTGGYNGPSLSTKDTLTNGGFEAQTYVWENGQVASYSQGQLYVADPIVPFQDLTTVRVLPSGVVGSSAHPTGANQADETSLPTSGGIGTWTKVDDPLMTPRLIETQFANGFTAMSDQKAGTIRVTAADGSTLDTNSTLVETNGAYRMQTRHPLGSLEQSLLPEEVLLTLQINDRTLIVQHKAGFHPIASESKDDEDFLDASDALGVSMDDKGAYLVQDGVVQIEIQPLMPLEFLQKKAS